MADPKEDKLATYKEDFKQKVLELASRPREEVLSEYENSNFSLIEKFAYILWKFTDDKTQARVKFFENLRNLYKSHQPKEKIELSEEEFKIFKTILVERIDNGGPGARVTYLFSSEGRAASSDDIPCVLIKARDHPLRKKTLTRGFSKPENSSLISGFC